MKKSIVLLLVLAFVASIASVAFARTIDEERDAVRSYLKVIDVKIIKYRKAGNTAKMKVLQADKKATLARWEKLKASMGATVVPPTPGAPVPPPPPPRPVVSAAPAATTGLFGMGIQTAVEAGLQAGMGAVSASVMLPDPLGLGGMIGLPSNAVMYKLGVGYAAGNDSNSQSWKALPIMVGGVIMLPSDIMGGIQSFIGGGLNYVAYRTGQTSGTIGGDIYAGVAGDLGLGGKTYGQVGYSILRSGTDKGGPHSSKSVSLMVGQMIQL